MRLQKSPEPTYNGHRERFMSYLPIVVRTSIDQQSSHVRICEDDHDTYNAPPSSYDPPDEARLTKPRPDASGTVRYEDNLPASLRPAGAYTGRPYALNVIDFGDNFGNQMPMIRARHDRIDSWIDHLDSQISLARAEDSDLENVPLTHDMPPLAQAEHSRPRTWSGHEWLAVPVKSVHGSILMASTAGSGGLSRWPGSGSIPIGMSEDGTGVVVVEGPWLRSEILIIGLLCLTQAVQMYPYGQSLATAVSLSTSLFNENEQMTQKLADRARPRFVADARWLTASYPLTQGAFVLIGGRLGMVYGHKLMLLMACIWWTALQIACAFSPTVAVLCVLRGLTGIGAAFTTPNAAALLSTNIPPGRKRALANSLFDAMSPVGAAAGCLVSALLMQLTQDLWSFVVPSCYGGVIFGLVWYAVPRDSPSDHRGKIDWTGAYLGLAGLILFCFVWNEAPSVGWSTPYIYVLLIAAIGHLVSFAFWEAKLAPKPLVPTGVWRLRHFPRTLFISTFSFMSLGIFLWYFSLYGVQIRQQNLMETGASFQPMTVLPVAVVVAAVLLMPRVLAEHLQAGANLALVIGNVLVATSPTDLTYWAMSFPAICFVSIAAALMLPAAHTMAVENGEQKHQAIASSLISTMLGYGLSTGIGIAATVELQTSDEGRNVSAGYRSALVFAIALSGTALVGSVMFLGGGKRSKTGGFEQMKESRPRDSASSLVAEILRIRP